MYIVYEMDVKEREYAHGGICFESSFYILINITTFMAM